MFTAANDSDGESGSIRFLGVGVYEIPEAARLARIHPARLRRWLEDRNAIPLWRPDLPRIDGRLGLSFLDLVQTYVLAELLRQELPVRTMRRLVQKAKEALQTEHPLASARFRTDGKRLYLEVLREEPTLLDLLRGQFAFHRVVAPSLKPLDYDADEMASRWWPLGKGELVVIDPKRNFGKPITAKSGVPTATLFAQYKVYGNIEELADAYEIDRREAEAAIRFEKQLEEWRSRPKRAA